MERLHRGEGVTFLLHGVERGCEHRPRIVIALRERAPLALSEIQYVLFVGEVLVAVCRHSVGLVPQQYVVAASVLAHIDGEVFVELFLVAEEVCVDVAPPGCGLSPAPLGLCCSLCGFRAALGCQGLWRGVWPCCRCLLPLSLGLGRAGLCIRGLCCPPAYSSSPRCSLHCIGCIS